MRKSSLLFLGAALGAGAVFMTVPGRVGIEARAAETPATQSASDTYKQLALFGLIFDQVRAHYVDDRYRFQSAGPLYRVSKRRVPRRSDPVVGE